MFTEVRVFDADGSFLPDNALSSDGALYAEVAKMQRFRRLAWKLEERLDTFRGPCMAFREQMSARAEERCHEAYDRYTERCKGIEIVTVTRNSRFSEGHTVHEFIS